MAPRGAVVLLLALALALALTRSAGAAPAADPTEKEARELFRKAEISFNLGRFPEALGDYQAAYQAMPLPGFLFNIAQCYRNMEDYDRARFFYRRYLTLDPRTSNRRKVEDLIADMTRLIEKREQAQPPGGVNTSVPKSEPVSPPPPPVRNQTWMSPSPAGGPSLVTTERAPVREDDDPVYTRWWFWGGIGAVVVGGAVAAFMLSREDQPRGTLDPINGRLP